MRPHLVGCMVILILTSTLAENEDENTNKDQEEEYEDIAVAESQDIVHSHSNLSNEEEYRAEIPGPRTRSRKRRRRLRKRPRPTTPSLGEEEYVPDELVKMDDGIPYQRRRPNKRRRRPALQHPDHNLNTSGMEPLPEQYEDHHRPRYPQRRRRKGGRKRMRTTTPSTDTIEESLELTTQPPEVMMQSNNYSSSENNTTNNSSPSDYQHDETTASTLPSTFTTKEITEINHKLELLSKPQQNSGNDYQVSGLGAFSFNHPTSTKLQPHNVEENHIVSSSTTPKDFSWLTRFEPKTKSRTTDFHEPRVNVELNRILKQDTQQNIKNIEKIIENRKNLFSKSRRLPLTSALIRRRLNPKKLQNSTKHETVIYSTIPNINFSLKKNESKGCQTVNCELNTLTNNIVPSALLPSGFPTMPEILSTAELIKKLSQRTNKVEHNFTIQSTPNSNYVSEHEKESIIIITPSTLLEFQSKEHGSPPPNKLIGTEGVVNEVTDTRADESLKTTIKYKIKDEERYLAPSIVDMKKTTTPTTNIIMETDKPTQLSNDTSFSTVVMLKGNPMTSTEPTSEPDKFKLDDIDTTNINDEILELIMDEMGKARVKRILELRNMSLSELIAHRERGAGHFSEYDDKNSSQNYYTKDRKGEKILKIQKKIDTEEHDSDDEEITEKMIIDKAKHIIKEYKRNDKILPHAVQFSKNNNLNFAKHQKVEGTVIPVPIHELTHKSAIEFPEDRVLGDFPKYMFDIVGKQFPPNQPFENEKEVLTEPLKRTKSIKELKNLREPRVFESMPRFSTEASKNEYLETSSYSDWKITTNKSPTEKSLGFPGISREIMFVASTTVKSPDQEDVFLLNEGDDTHDIHNHMLEGNINIESQDVADEDYHDEKKVPVGVKSAIAASGALLGLAIIGFLAVLVSCKIRQRRARLRVRRDILNERLAEDFRSSQRSLSPVLRKSPFNTGIHSNIASNRNYYLWRTLRKTFQYE